MTSGIARGGSARAGRQVIARPEPGNYDRDVLLVGGTWRQAGSDERVGVQDCSTEETLGRIRSGTPADVDMAVVAAADALPGWAATTPDARADRLRALLDGLRERSDELAALISAEVGTAIRMSPAVQVASSLRLIELAAELVTAEPLEEQLGNSLVAQQPAGVVAAITPWNYPLFQTVAKVAAAIAAGCTVVHKPSELAPLSSFVLAEVAQAALPGGVYNLVPGTGPVVGEALATHPGVSMVSFTGSTTAGRRVYQLAAGSIKRVSLELGGKSASVLLEDADLPKAVQMTVNRAFLNSGQTCDAWTRLLVPHARLAEVLDLAVAASGRLTVGDPFDVDTRLGPLISARQLARVRDYIDGALADGARVVTGGSAPPPGLDRGHYVQPTVLTGVSPEARVAREEVFGPVLAVMSFGSESEALAVANGTSYGLSGAVWSGDAERAMRFGRQMQAGQVVINGGGFNPFAPFGGVKQSGLGREQGIYGIREFLVPQALQC
jgi:aldehyde dehydrogenase (NAD+)